MPERSRENQRRLYRTITGVLTKGETQIQLGIRSELYRALVGNLKSIPENVVCHPWAIKRARGILYADRIVFYKTGIVNISINGGNQALRKIAITEMLEVFDPNTSKNSSGSAVTRGLRRGLMLVG